MYSPLLTPLQLSFSNAVTTQLWEALGEASGQPVAAAMKVRFLRLCACVAYTVALCSYSWDECVL